MTKPWKMEIRVHSRMYNDATAALIVAEHLRNAYGKRFKRIFAKGGSIYAELAEEVPEEEIIGLKEEIAEESEILARLEFVKIE